MTDPLPTSACPDCGELLPPGIPAIALPGLPDASGARFTDDHPRRRRPFRRTLHHRGRAAGEDQGFEQVEHRSGCFVVIPKERLVGRLEQDDSGSLWFSYSGEWMNPHPAGSWCRQSCWQIAVGCFHSDETALFPWVAALILGGCAIMVMTTSCGSLANPANGDCRRVTRW